MNSVESAQNSSRRNPVDLGQIELSRKIIEVEVIAHNSVGQSPKALLTISRTVHGKRVMPQTLMNVNIYSALQFCTF